MSHTVNSRTGRYLGNNNPYGDHEVHDLNNEKSQCQIDTILRNGNGVGFVPDTLSQAHAERFDNCAWCIGRSTR